MQIPKPFVSEGEVSRKQPALGCLSCRHLREASNPANRDSYAMCGWMPPEFPMPYIYTLYWAIKNTRALKDEASRWRTAMDLYGGGEGDRGAVRCPAHEPVTTETA